MIYLVEDDASIRELVAYALNNSGFEAEGFAAPADFWKAMEHRRPRAANMKRSWVWSWAPTIIFPSPLA